MEIVSCSILFFLVVGYVLGNGIVEVGGVYRCILNKMRLFVVVVVWGAWWRYRWNWYGDGEV
jgi:membrane protein DedA with SNARE-associated domain